MDNIAGSPVEGDNFYGREPEIARLLELLDHHDILLLGPRRIGKTSIARAVMAKCRAAGWGAVEVNVAECQDERGFLLKLEKALEPALASVANKLAGSVKDQWAALSKRIKSCKVGLSGVGEINLALDPAAQEEDWPRLANDLLQLLARAGQRYLIYLDELPIFLFTLIRNDPATGVARVRRLLDWFRNDLRAMPELKSMRWLVSGSVGLDTLAQQHGMADTINSFSHQSLQPFSDPVACAMLTELAARYGIPWGEQDAIKLVAAVGWAQPYYLQFAFNRLRTLHAATPPAAEPTPTQQAARMAGIIDQAVANMAEPGADNDFHHWEQRLRMQLPSVDAEHSLALLTWVAKTTDGLRAETLFALFQDRLPNATGEQAKAVFVRLRDILQRDGYWWPDGSGSNKRYRFRLEPLRQWWHRRNEL